MTETIDPNDPRLTHGTDDQPVPQAEAYLRDFLQACGSRRGPALASVLLEYADFLGLDEEQRQRCRDALEVADA